MGLRGVLFRSHPTEDVLNSDSREVSEEFAHVLPAAIRKGGTRPRRVTPEAGKALEMLGHSIEYLTEFIERRCFLAFETGEVEAIEILEDLNRRVYFECPERTSVVEKLRTLLRLRPAVSRRLVG